MVGNKDRGIINKLNINYTINGFIIYGRYKYLSLYAEAE
jgi:hypothetical protein